MDRTVHEEQKLNLIEMKGIRRDYSCGSNLINALKGIDLTIAQGEFVAIMGPSGSGKSTLLNIMGCLDSPTAGTYHLKGKNISNLSRKEKALIRNKAIGFVFQAYNLLPELNIASNVALPLKYGGVPKSKRQALVNEALASVGLEGMGYRYPDQLSGGQQQRVAIARALVNKPDIILADEPTGNLDSVSGQSIMEELRRLNLATGTTIVVITHDSRIAGYADRLVRLVDGRINDDMRVKKASQTKSTLINPFGWLEEGENEEIL